VLGFVNKHLAQNSKSTLEANASIVERLKVEAVKVCSIAYEQTKKSAYKVKYCEKTFGKEDSELKTVTFKGKNCDIKLNGAIDRIDEWDGRARVIDYKTGGGGSFSYQDLFYATKLQLPLYMEVAKQNGYKSGGFFYFPFASNWSDDGTKKWDGVFEESDENITAMEVGALSNGGEIIDLPLYKTKGKNYGLPNKKNGLTEEEINKVCDYAMRMVQNALTNIENGEFECSPIKKSSKSVCSYCPFVGVCKKDEFVKERKKVISDGNCKKYLTGGDENATK
jgi:ATP-dependent helicase/DNAse subunit B